MTKKQMTILFIIIFIIFAIIAILIISKVLINPKIVKAVAYILIGFGIIILNIHNFDRGYMKASEVINNKVSEMVKDTITELKDSITGIDSIIDETHDFDNFSKN